MEELIQELKKQMTGEVRFDKQSRILYSTDASIFEIEPLGVVIPKSADDLQAIVEIAYRYGVPIIPRGGGTSIVGNSIGAGIVIDCSKYLNNILEVNREENWARIQPGVVLDQLNTHLRQFDLLFGPDVATSSRANIGGMIGNNSSGAHSILYGKTLNHVLELDVFLSNGDKTHLRSLSPQEWLQQLGKDDLLGSIYRRVDELVRENREEIDKRFPKILRRVAGYNLDEFVRETHNNLAKIIVGSEGTLSVISEAKINLVPLKKYRTLAVVHFEDMFQALDAVSPILEFHPAAVELLDNNIIDLTRKTMEYARRLTFIEGFPAAVLLVEFEGGSEKEAVSKLEKLAGFLAKKKIGYVCHKAIDAAAQEDVWYIRKAGLGLLLGTKADRKPIGFIEDSAVAPEKMPQYIKRFDEIVRSCGTDASYYAHASVGCLHVRPKLNLKEPRDVEIMAEMADAISSLALEFGGTISGEHGDGLAHSCWNEKMFGSQLYNAFREVKKAFDPKNIMNPGKIVDAQFLTENFRHVPQPEMKPVKPFFNYSEEGGFQKAIEMCNGNGFCRKKDGGTMCPSYMVTLEEEHSTRGRANALRAILTGKVDKSAYTSGELYRTLELCVSCKGCKGECPTNVDMAKLKEEFLYHYHRAHGLPIRDRLFGNIALLSKIGSVTAPVSNWMLNLPSTRWLLQAFLGIHHKRKLPPFRHKTLEAWFRKHHNGTWEENPKTVVFFHDTFVNYNYPHIGQAAVKLLEAAGYDVILPEKKCCGRPFISKGMLDEAKANALYNLEKLYPYVEKGYPIVGLEPSCMVTFREEYPAMLDDPRVSALAENTFLFEEFFMRLLREEKVELKFRPADKKYLLHGHCHQKAVVGLTDTEQMLALIPNATVETVDSGCCGMAGSFGFEKEHYDISIKMGERKLFASVRKADADWQVVAPGTSCRQQIEHGTGRKAKHPVEILAEHLAG